jgi:antitoxin component of RelBE/YafQ-DinJ toxin-antitoxin module
MSEITITIDERTKREAEAALAPLGLTPSELGLRLMGLVARLRESPIAAIIVAEAMSERIDPQLLHEVLEKLADDKNIRPILMDVLDGPFVPNAETIAAMEEAKRGGLKKFASIDELFADLNSDADD